MKRRTFLKSIAATGAAASVGSAANFMLPRKAHAKKKVDIGEIKSVRIDVLSETSWFNNDILKKNMMDYGGAMTNQYTIPWDNDNSGGYAALITVTTLEGNERKILMDSGWSNDWMDYIFEEKNDIANMLKKDEIETFVLSHWHLDHTWGIESTLKHKQDITMYAPKTYYPEDMALLKEKAHHKAKDKNSGEMIHVAKNDYPHTGKLVLCTPDGDKGDGVYRLMPGVAVRMFDVPILLRVRGENVLYFNVKDKGIVTVTGCCHPGILSLFSYARKNFKGYQPYGCYGGLHITLFETWEPKFDDIIKGVKAFKIQKLGCNHCTGWIWAEKAAAAGVPVVKGTDKYKEYKRTSTVAKASNVFLTNGDHVVF
ncbi:MAG: MBL fold metallo-hydrolase [Desulfobacterales bacterium]|jgi:7,8-dihydropterin-6-yl-methyl-4-(beta-D-ribofuranosyl)aminobenzene 5'-phosphate synthase